MRGVLSILTVALAMALAFPGSGYAGAPSQQEYTENAPSATRHPSDGGSGPLVPTLIGLASAAAVVIAGGAAWRIRRRATSA
jgi:hypothetical protein